MTRDEVVEGAKRCTHCGTVKPVDQFYANAMASDGKQSWCRTCIRVDCAMRSATPARRAWLAAYRARPDVRRRRREYDAARERLPARRERHRAYRRTVLGRMLHARDAVLYRLRRATDPARRANLEALLARHDAEIARVRANMGGGSRESTQPGPAPAALPRRAAATSDPVHNKEPNS